MRTTAIFIFAALLLSVSAIHVLPHFNKDVSVIQDLYRQGHTSKVFSTFMKMLVHTRTLQQEL
jgi:hypothetical protein